MGLAPVAVSLALSCHPPITPRGDETHARPTPAASMGSPDRLCPGFEALASKVDEKARARSVEIERAYDTATPVVASTVVIGAGWAGTIAASCARDPRLLVLGQPDTWHSFGDFRAGQQKAEAPCLPKQPAAFEFASFRQGDFLHAATIGAAVMTAHDALDLHVAYEEVTSIARAPQRGGSPYVIQFTHGKGVLADRVVIATGVGDSNLLSAAQIDPALDTTYRSADPPVLSSETSFLARYGTLCEGKPASVDALGDVLVFGAGASGGQIAEALAESSHHTIYFVGPDAALTSLRASLGSPGHRLAKLFSGIDAGAPKRIAADAIAHVTQVAEGKKHRVRVELASKDGSSSSVIVDRVITAISQNPSRTRSLLSSFASPHLVPVLGRGTHDERVKGVPVALQLEHEEIYVAGAAAAAISPERSPWGMTSEESKDFWTRYRVYYESQVDPDARIPTGFLVVGPAIQDLMSQLGR